MTIQKTVEDLRAENNVLLIENAVLMTRVNALTSIVLGVYKETLSPAQYESVRQNFADALEKQLAAVFDNCPVEDPALVLRLRFEAFSQVKRLRRDEPTSF